MTAVRRKVCFVLPSLNGGGAERAAVQILNGLDRNRWDRSMFLFAREGPYLSEVDPAIAITSADTASRWGRWRALRSFVAGERPEIVMGFLSYFSVLSAARAANAGAKVVFNLQTPMSEFLSDADYPWRRRWHKAAFTSVTRLGYGAADLIVATSHGVARDLTSTFGISPDRIRVVANPVDLDRVRAAIAEPIDEALLPAGTSPLIVAAGRLAEAKNYPLMIEAFAAVRQQMPARLCILGQGEFEGTLRQLIAARGMGDAVSLAGFQANPWKFIARADVFLLTSRYEGFGNVLIEAMACGVPVVATASAGTRDIVQHGTDGLLVDVHSLNAVATNVLSILESPARRAAMSRAAAESADRFAVQQVISRYDAVLEQLAS
jgi:glycosyltransferase involved in cell wall biosynthesis